MSVRKTIENLSRVTVTKRAVIAVTVVSVLLLLGFFVRSAPQADEPPLPPPKPQHRLTFSGAVPYFAAEAAFQSLKQYAQKLNRVSLFWYQLEQDGSIDMHEEVDRELEEEVLTFTRQQKLKTFVGIDNGEDTELVTPLFADNDLRAEHVRQVEQLLREKGYDGVVVDYEGLEQDQAAAFTSYIHELAEAVHALGKSITVAIEIETTGRVFHGMDIVDLSKLVDQLELSTYEEFGDETGPGPIASVNWVHMILANIIKQGVRSNKIIMGTAHSSHEWELNGRTTFVRDAAAIKGIEKLSATGAQLQWDNTRQSSFFEYEEGDDKRVVWLEEARGFTAKIDLAKAYELNGIFIWYLGGEDPQIWEVW